MKSKVKDGAAPIGTRMSIQEEAGVKLAHQLIKLDPFPQDSCSREKCTTVVEGRETNQCYSTCFQAHINYKITCEECERDRKEGRSPILRIYYGESSRGCYERFLGHLAQYKAKKTGFMWKHDQEIHGGKGKCVFRIQRTNVDKDALRRVVRESIKLRSAENDPNVDLLNTKDEWFGLQTVAATFSQEW